MAVQTLTIGNRQRRKRVTRALRRSVAYLITTIFAVLFTIPFLWMISLSLKTPPDLAHIPPRFIPKPIDWHNYVEAMQMPMRPFSHFLKNTVPLDFLRLLHGTTCLVGNSSVGIRECSFLGVPVVNIGSRQTGREFGRNAIHVDYDRTAITDGLRRHQANGRYSKDELYGDGNAGQRIAQKLAHVELTIDKKLTY